MTSCVIQLLASKVSYYEKLRHINAMLSQICILMCNICQLDPDFARRIKQIKQKGPDFMKAVSVLYDYVGLSIPPLCDGHFV